MPTILREGPYRFYFVSGDRDEPPHVHIQSDDRFGKVLAQPRSAAEEREFWKGRASPHSENC